jgi:hypothetical protein
MHDEADMGTSPLAVGRSEILAFRRRVAALDERLPAGDGSLRSAAWAGLQDSMPRAALLSIHARLEATGARALDDPSLVQIWGPRFSAYVVAASDLGVFTLGRLGDDTKVFAHATALADDLEAFLGGRRMGYGEAGRGMGIPPNRLRYAAPTGRVVMRWDGARQPTIWTVRRPDIDPVDARLELARRYLTVFGPTTPGAFARWAGIGRADGPAAFAALAPELVRVATPIGEGWILASDEAVFRAPQAAPAAARLLPSGDTLFLLWGRDRALLVPDAAHRAELWTSRVWPGAVLVGGEVVGTWRRSLAKVSIAAWRPLSAGERAAVESEAASLPLPGIEGTIQTRWE